ALNRLGRNRAKDTDKFGKRYVSINDACREIAKEINQPLYLVDTMFSLIVHENESPLAAKADLTDDSIPTVVVNAAIGNDGISINQSYVFPLEKFLEEFLVSNWEKTVLGKTLSLHSEDEESATQYPTDVGEIDILAREKS